MKKVLFISTFFLLFRFSLICSEEINTDSLNTESVIFRLSWQDFAEKYFGPASPVKKQLHYYLEKQMITYELYKDDVFLDYYKIQSMDAFLKHYSEISTKKLWAEKTKESISQEKGAYSQGLVPDIELPKIKTPISGIIGEGGKLAVQGSEKIDFGGQKTSFYDQVHYPNETRSILPELKMKQILNVNLKGTVGEKINVFIDHNSESESDLQNKIKLQYKGDEDEIVQLIEAGDTDMSLPGTKVIGAPPSYKGLFGIKTLLKVGPIDVTAVASKEQGESDQTTFVGQAKQDTVKIYDIDYLRNSFFYLDMNFGANDTITHLSVYIDDRNYTNDSSTVSGKAYIDADTLDSTLAYSGMFDKILPSSGYELYNDNVLLLNTYLGMQYVLGIRYIKKDKNTGQIIDTVGSFPAGDPLVLKLLKPENNEPSYPTWDYELRNIYSIGASDISKDKISISIKRMTSGAGIDSSTQKGEEYAYLLGIDEDKNGFVDPQFVDEIRGYIVFPNMYPFADTILDSTNAIIYDTTSTEESLAKYYIELLYKGARTIITIGQLNIIEGSEVVKINGVTLQRDVDYTIDYNTGMVEFKGNGTTLMAQPDAKLTIDYQYAPFFSTASKSLVGIRGEYNLSENNKIGTSWIYRNISTYDERPKLGQEPRSVVVGEIDGSITTHPNFLTTVTDKIPLIETEEPSQANVAGVVALSMPDPNSTGEVYIDDMEGIKQTTDIGSSMWQWHFGSIPQGNDTSTIGKYYWYEPNDRIPRGDIFPNLPDEQKDDLTSYLQLVFYPKNDDPNSWMSITNLISKTGEDLSKAKFLEFWVRGTSGTLHFDIGRSIPEDAPRWTKDGKIVGYNGTIDTEDKNKDGLLDKNPQNYEDTGLDRVIGKDINNISGDDGNDDYPEGQISKSNYHKLDGTENNNRLDSEDLDRDGSLNTGSRYTEYSISLANADSSYIAEETDKGWRLFRIPLVDTTISNTIGQMDWEYVKYVRLWVNDFTQEDSLQFYSLEITSTTWENKGISSVDTFGSSTQPGEEFFVTQKNTEENPGYTPPFDPGQDQYGRPKREQSLALEYQNIEPRHKGSVFLQTTKAEDYTTYKNMKLYVKCDKGNPVKFFIRIGGDSTTYYQFEKTLLTSWEEITIPFKSFTDLKVEAPEDSTHYKKGNYSFKKNPSLTNIKYLELGFVNENNTSTTGEIWIDELRLTSPRRDKGTSMNVSAELKIADFITLTGSISKTDADFQQLNMNKITRSNILSYQYQGNLAFGKFFPKLWGLNIPLSYNQNKSIGYPKYKTGSDIVLDSEQAKKEKSMNGAITEGINFSKGSHSTNFLIHFLIDPVKINATNKSSYSFTPTNLDSTMNRSLSGTYGYQPGLKPVRVFGLFDFNYFPGSFSSTTGYNKTVASRFTNYETGWKMTTFDLKRYLTLSNGVQYNPINILRTNYSDDRIRDLDINYEGDEEKKRFGEQVNLNKSFSSSLSPSLWDWSRPTFSFTSNYSEDRKPENRTLVVDSFPVRNVGNNNAISLSFDFALPRFLQLFTHIRNESKDSTAVIGTPQWLAIKLEEFSRHITRPNISIGRNRQTAFGLLKNRPSWEYQFGLTESIPTELQHSEPKQGTPYDHKSASDNFTTSSGFNTSFFSLTTSFTQNKSTSITPSSEQSSKSKTWPDIGLQFPQVTKLFPKNDVLKNVSTSINYREENSSNEINSEPQSESENISWGPSFQITWIRDIRTSISGNFSTNKSKSIAATQVNTISVTTGYNFSVSYSFRAPSGLKLPWIGHKIHFSSNLDAGMDLNYSKNYATSSSVPDGPTNYMINYMLSPRLSYNFSENITGGLIGNYSMMNDKKTNSRSSTTGMDVWVEFKF